jgi:hypothetical protein
VNSAAPAARFGRRRRGGAGERRVPVSVFKGWGGMVVCVCGFGGVWARHKVWGESSKRPQMGTVFKKGVSSTAMKRGGDGGARCKGFKGQERGKRTSVIRRLSLCVPRAQRMRRARLLAKCLFGEKTMHWRGLSECVRVGGEGGCVDRWALCAVLCRTKPITAGRALCVRKATLGNAFALLWGEAPA